jgi:hypothetical protein
VLHAILGEYAVPDMGTLDGEADREGSRETVCAILHCARTGATPDGRPLREQGEVFRAVLATAHEAISAQARMNSQIFLEMCKSTAGMMGAFGK